MRELRPGDPDALAVDLEVRAVRLGEEIRHSLVEQLRGEPLAALDALVHLALEARERRHDEEVPVEVRHRLVEHRELELAVVDRLEEVRAQQRLVEVRRDLGHEQRVARRDLRLRLPGEVGVHRVPELVGERAEAHRACRRSSSR